MTRHAPIGGRLVRTLALLLLAPLAARAQDACEVDVHAATRHWLPPLDRTVSFAVHDAPLRDALDLLASSARIQLSYSSELLPLGRRVCIRLDSVAAGDALTTLLQGVAFEPVVAGEDRVVLAPPPRAVALAPRTELASRVGVLERVLVTSSAIPRIERGTTTAATVLGRDQLSRQASSSMSELLDSSVPGMWLWNQAPANLLGGYGSIRGASSFGISYPKMYIDGIEVANPLLVTNVDPDVVDRIEVIRGPQGAALYGADAISGVVNVVTRHDGVDASGEWLRVHSDAGLSKSTFALRPVLAQEHGATLRGGSATRSATLGVSTQSIGDYMPNAGSSEVRVIGGVRFVGSRSTISGTARYFAKNAGSPTNPLVDATMLHVTPGTRLLPGSDSSVFDTRTDAGPQSVRQYTVGATMTVAQSDRITHSFVAGVDGYSLTNVTNGMSPLPVSADLTLHPASGAADRTTLRATTRLHLGGSGRTDGIVTVSAEHSMLREESTSTFAAGVPQVPGGTSWWASSGLVARASGSLDDALFVSGGIRLEHDAGTEPALLPMLGLAYVHAFGGVTAKLRTAYGRGLRPARTAIREAAWLGVRDPRALKLSPEEQSGIEAGADLLLGRAIALHLTRFDQRAYGLVQPVAVNHDQASAATATLAYSLQNVGEIANRGWELQSTITAGRLVITSALSLTDSRVTHVAEGYTGDLREGDRMLGVPARLASLTASWSGARWSTAWGVSRAMDWVNYNRLAIALATSEAYGSPRVIAGPDLRGYWFEYPGVTRLRGSFTRDLTRRWALQFTGENLLDQQLGEPDDASVLPGRTLSLGLRARF